PAGSWAHVTATYDGSSRAAGVRIYLDGKPTELEVIRDKLTKDITYGGSEPDLAIGYRFRDSGFKGGAVADFAVVSRAVSALEAAVLAGAEPPADREALFEHFLAAVHAPAAAWRKELHA